MGQVIKRPFVFSGLKVSNVAKPKISDQFFLELDHKRTSRRQL